MEIQLKNKLKMELNNVNSTSYKTAMDVTEAVIMVITNYFLFFLPRLWLFSPLSLSIGIICLHTTLSHLPVNWT